MMAPSGRMPIRSKPVTRSSQEFQSVEIADWRVRRAGGIVDFVFAKRLDRRAALLAKFGFIVASNQPLPCS